MPGGSRGVFHVEGGQGDDVCRWYDVKGARSRWAIGKDGCRRSGVSTRVDTERGNRRGRGFGDQTHCAHGSSGGLERMKSKEGKSGFGIREQERIDIQSGSGRSWSGWEETKRKNGKTHEGGVIDDQVDTGWGERGRAGNRKKIVSVAWS